MNGRALMTGLSGKIGVKPVLHLGLYSSVSCVSHVIFCSFIQQNSLAYLCVQGVIAGE